MTFENTIDRWSVDFLRRSVAISIVKGRRETSTVDNIPTRGSVQTLSGKERQALPEADRLTQSIKVYTKDPINMDDVLFSIPQFEGEFLVRTVEQWLEYYKVIAVKQ